MLKERALCFVLPLKTVLLVTLFILGFNGQRATATPGRITEGCLVILGPDREGLAMPSSRGCPAQGRA